MDRQMDRRTVAKGAGALAGAAALGFLPGAVAAAAQATGSAPAELTLYERLGGYFGIAAVVNRFSDKIIVNAKLNENPALRAWNQNEAEMRLPGLKFGRTLWVAAMAGGPFEYTGLPLNEAHAEFHLSADEFNEVAAEIISALDFYGVQEREKQELATAYATAMTDVVTA
jgi:hemoglobin